VRNLDKEVASAVRSFWKTRDRQSKKQGSTSGRRDQGARSAVTGGKQLDGFVTLVRDIIIEAGIDESSIFYSKHLELPGFYRPEKKWDLVVVQSKTLLVAVEFKSHVGPSFGNNFNNRTEEAIGNAQDIWTAFREGAFSTSQRPWLGYLLLLEDTEKSTSPVSVRESHFPVFPEFVDASYADRYQILMNKLIRERMYDSACFIMSSKTSGKRGIHSAPSLDLSFRKFAASLSTRLKAFLETEHS